MIRSLLSTLKSYATSTALNLLGLSLAFAAFFVLLLQVDYERSFDRFHPKADRIYRVQFTDCATVPRALVETFGRSSSQIVRYSIADLGWQQSFTTQQNGVRTRWEEPMIQVSQDFPAIFDFQMVEGSADALSNPDHVLLPQSMAQKIFASGQAVGNQIVLGDAKNPLALTVGGVYRDVPSNTQINNTILRRMGDQIGRDTTDASGYRWRQWNYFLYVELAQGADPQALVDAYTAQMGDLSAKLKENKTIEIQPLPELYFDTRPMTAGYLVKHGDRTTSNILLLVALLVLVVAAVNFVNFATALAPMRIQAINIKKIFGAPNASLRWQLVAESLVLCGVAYALSLLWLSLAVYTPVVGWSMSGTVALDSNVSMALWTAGVALVLGLVAGVYPAFYTTRVPAVLALRGRYGTTQSGRMLRTGLVGVQFVVAIALISGALVLNEQNRYMRSIDTGIDKEGVLVVPLSDPMKGNMERLNLFADKAKAIPAIQDVAFSQFDMGASNFCQGWNLNIGQEMIDVECYPVSWNFPQVMGLQLADGDYLTAPITEDTQHWTLMLNQRAAQQAHNAQTGDMVSIIGGDPAKVQGVLKDFHHKSLHYPIMPMILVLGVDWWGNWAFVRYTGSPTVAMEHVKQITKELDPEYIGDIRFLDAAFDTVYKNELRNASMIMAFSVLVVLVALMGVFGLVIFDSRYRRREIGLRRVYGSSTNSILKMFNLQFVKIVGVCFVVAVPLAWWAAESWLSNFTVRTPIHWWIFVLAGAIVLAITVLTVTAQAWRTAHENPVHSIKTE